MTLEDMLSVLVFLPGIDVFGHGYSERIKTRSAVFHLQNGDVVPRGKWKPSWESFCAALSGRIGLWLLGVASAASVVRWLYLSFITTRVMTPGQTVKPGFSRNLP